MAKKSFKGMIFVVLRAVFILVKSFQFFFSLAYHWIKFNSAIVLPIVFQALAQTCEKKILLTSSFLSVLSSVRLEKLGFKWVDFHEIWYVSNCRKTAENIQVSLKSWKE